MAEPQDDDEMDERPIPPRPRMPSFWGGIIPWGAPLSNGTRLLIPKQPRAARLVSVSFPWALAVPTNLQGLVFSVVFLDGGANEIMRVSHDVSVFPFPMAQEQAEAIVGAADMSYPEITLSAGKITFGLSLVPQNIAKFPQSPGSSAWNPGDVISEHPLPWHMTVAEVDQVAVELLSISPVGQTPTVSNVAYRFRNF